MRHDLQLAYFGTIDFLSYWWISTNERETMIFRITSTNGLNEWIERNVFCMTGENSKVLIEMNNFKNLGLQIEFTERFDSIQCAY